MINTELSACLDEMMSANEEDRAAIREHIMNENQTLVDSAARFTDGVPSGYSNWQEAYNGARSTYVKSLMNRGQNTDLIPEVGPDNGSTELPPANSENNIKINDLFS